MKRTPEQLLKHAANQRRYRQRHPDRAKSAVDRWKAANKDRFNARMREWYANNKERISQKLKALRLENPEKYKEYARVYYRKAKLSGNTGFQERWQLRRAKKMRASIGKIDMRTLSLARKKGIACPYCGNLVRGRKVNADHIIPLCRGGAHSAANIQLICEACNKSKNHRTPNEWIEHGQLILC